MANHTLQLFPSHSSVEDAKEQCLKTCASRSTSPDLQTRPYPPRTSSRDASTMNSIYGMTVQVTPRPGKSPFVEPAAKHVKHSLFCDPPTETPGLSTIRDDISEQPEDIPHRPERRSGQRAPTPGLPRRSSSLQRHRAQYRRSGASEVLSLASGSPSLARSNSGATARLPSPAQSVPMRSMFPQYEPNIPLAQQQYYPKPTTDVQPHPIYNASKGSLSPTSLVGPPKPRLSKCTEPQLGLPLVADEQDLVHVWSAANGIRSNERIGKVQLMVQRNKNSATGIAFGTASGAKLYAAELPGPDDKNHGTRQVNIKRQHPVDACPLPVAQIECRTYGADEQHNKAESVYETSHHVASIFPQQAALNALQAAANSIQASKIAQFDPRASSPQTAQLAFNAVEDAKENEECELDYRPSFFDASSPSTYNLHHPRLGDLAVTVTGRVNMKDWTSHRCSRTSTSKITIHQPRLSGTSSAANLPSLATLDLAVDMLELDLAALTSLDSIYMIDTVMCTLVAVAACETSHYTDKPTTAFEAPAVSPRKESKGKKNVSSPSPSPSPVMPMMLFPCPSEKKVPFWKRFSWKSKAEKRQEKKEKEKSRLPAIARGVLHLLGFSFDVIIWLLSLGVKVLTKLVSCVGGAIDKA